MIEQSKAAARAYKRAYEDAQAGGMNETECDEFATEQAERERDIASASAALAALYAGRPVDL